MSVDKSGATEEIEVDLTQVPPDTNEEDEFPSVDEILAACSKRSSEAGDNQYEIEKLDVVVALKPDGLQERSQPLVSTPWMSVVIALVSFSFPSISIFLTAYRASYRP